MRNVNLLKNQRYITIFRELVETYIETGEPVGSRSISKKMEPALSPATIRNVMADLEDFGILCSEHSSSGRKPTEKGWRIFVNQLIEVDEISQIEKDILETITAEANGKSVQATLEKASDILSELSKCVSLIVVPTMDAVIKHIDFILLSKGKAIVIIITEDGLVENRLIDVPTDISPAVFEKARNYINMKLNDMNLCEIKEHLKNELETQKEGIESVVRSMIQQGIDFISDEECSERIIIKGQTNIISNNEEAKNLKKLLQKLHEKQTIKTILDKSIKGQGVQVFIGSESKMFDMTDCSMLIAPYKNSQKKIVGMIGVFGQSRMRYSRVITLLNYTSDLLEKII